jgi:hypothetical protein
MVRVTIEAAKVMADAKAETQSCCASAVEVRRPSPDHARYKEHQIQTHAVLQKRVIV